MLTLARFTPRAWAVLWLRCDGYRVELSGNVGRFNRADNLFGYDFPECVCRANQLNVWSLPPFTAGEPTWVFGNGVEWTGAVATRIDVTQNVCLWSPENVRLFLRYLAGKQKGRVKVGVSSDGASVMWGYGSKYANLIAYDKAVELERHAKRGRVSSEVLDYVRALGVVRIEAKFKTRFLTQRRCRFLGEISMAKVEQLFHESGVPDRCGGHRRERDRWSRRAFAGRGGRAAGVSRGREGGCVSTVLGS